VVGRLCKHSRRTPQQNGAATIVRLRNKINGTDFGIIPNYVVFWTFDFQQGVLASPEFLFAALRGGRCLSAPEPSWIDQTASAPTSGALLMCPFFAGRPHIAVGIKGPMNLWIWYHTKLYQEPLAFGLLKCSAGWPPKSVLIAAEEGGMAVPAVRRLVFIFTTNPWEPRSNSPRTGRTPVPLSKSPNQSGLRYNQGFAGVQ
jgi:hypothetical protein